MGNGVGFFLHFFSFSLGASSLSVFSSSDFSLSVFSLSSVFIIYLC